jgi:hypothetical protein
MNTTNKYIFYVMMFIVFIICCQIRFSANEAFTNKLLSNKEKFSLIGEPGLYPKSEENYLVQESFPRIKEIGISNNGSNDIWRNYPIFKLGSYDQITNNIKYPDNPDEGTCMPASMCGALYQPKEILGPHGYGVNNDGNPLQLKSNYTVKMLPIEPNLGTRVGYFITESNLLPLKTDTVNILY